MYDMNGCSDMKLNMTSPLKIPEGCSPEEHLAILQHNYEMLYNDVDRLCGIMEYMQFTISRFMSFSESSINFMDEILNEHCKKFHSGLIITGKTQKEESDKNENHIP